MAEPDTDLHLMASDIQEPSDESKLEQLNATSSDVIRTSPLDQGWAWMVCAGCFVITFIMSMYDFVLAVMFVDVVELFEVSVTTAAAVFTIHASCFSVGSVLSTNVIVPKFGDRKVIVCAAIINSMSTVIIAFSPNIVYYLAFHSLKGFSIGSMWIPALGLLGHYFKRRRSLATSLTNAGIAVSLLATPPLVRHLLERFDFQGALLIISWFEMQAIAAAMLLKSPFAQKISRTTQTTDSFYLSTEDSTKESNSLLKNKESISVDVEMNCELHETKPCSVCKQRNLASSAEYECSINNYKHNSFKNDNTTVSPSIPQDDDFLYKKTSDTVLDASDKINLQKEKVSLLPDLSDNNLDNSTNVACHKRKLKGFTSENEDEQCKIKDNRCIEKKNDKVCKCSSCSLLTKVFDTKLLCDFLMVILLTSTVFGALVQYVPTYIPTLAVKRDVPKAQAAMLLTICGGVNLVCSVVQGLIIDYKIITVVRFIAIAQLIVGTMCHLTHFFNSFPTLVLLSVAHGMFGGSRMSLMPVLAMDFVGVSNLSKALGYNAMVATLSLSLHHPFLGYILESTGSFSVPFHYVGTALYISAGLILMEPIARRLNSKRASIR